MELEASGVETGKAEEYWNWDHGCWGQGGTPKETAESDGSTAVVVQLLSLFQFFATLWTAAHQSSLSFTVSRSLLKLMCIELVMPSNRLIPWNSLLFLPLIFSSIKVFSSELALHIRWPKYWTFRFSISPSNEYSGLISFRIDWFDLLAVQGTLKSLL